MSYTPLTVASYEPDQLRSLIREFLFSLKSDIFFLLLGRCHVQRRPFVGRRFAFPVVLRGSAATVTGREDLLPETHRRM